MLSPADRYLPARLSLNLCLFDPVPGNLICTARGLDLLGYSTANSCMDISACGCLRDVLALYPHECVQPGWLKSVGADPSAIKANGAARPPRPFEYRCADTAWDPQEATRPCLSRTDLPTVSDRGALHRTPTPTLTLHHPTTTTGTIYALRRGDFSLSHCSCRAVPSTSLDALLLFCRCLSALLSLWSQQTGAQLS